MRTTLIAALLAATTLIPAAAIAQDGPRYGQQTPDDGDRAQRPARPDRPGPGFEQGRPDRPDRAQFDRARPAPPQPGGWRGDGNRQFGGQARRPDRPDFDRNHGAQAAWQSRDRDGTEHWHHRVGDRDGGARWQDRNGDGRSDWQSRDRDRDGTPNWRDRDRDHDGVPDWRDRDNRGGWNRGDDHRGWRSHDYDRGRYDQRRDWNRDWRHDNRYDWYSYRNYNRGAYHLPRYYGPRGYGYGYRRYSIGVTLDAGYFGSNYWIDEPYDYRLPPAYGPYRWVRYYDDALLVDVRSGYVVDVVYGIFW